jgi:ankyrin repeat protein
MNALTHTEKALVSRLRSHNYTSAMSLLTSVFVNKDDLSSQHVLGEFLNNSSPIQFVSDILSKYPELIEQKDNKGNCILFYAAKNHRIDALKLIAKGGKDIFGDINGFGTCLHIAARCDNPKTIREMLVMGFDHHIKNSRGETAEDISRRWGNYANVTLFDKLSNDHNALDELMEAETNRTHNF